jgi:CheY-like chemotaxis protein
MTITRALIVDDDPAIIHTVGDIVRSLGHSADTAGDVETAKARLAGAAYDYLVLDMKIPVSPDRKLGRRENGRNLIHFLRANPQTVNLPIIVVTGEDSGESEFIISVLEAGGMAATKYIQKPIDGDKLDRAIQCLLAKRVGGGSSAPVELRPFCTEERRILEIASDRITLCGVQVWTDCAYPETGQILTWLAERGPHGYIRINGNELCQRLGRNASNPIGGPVKRFRESCREKMAACMGLDCGLYDVIGRTKGGGYHLTEHIEARVAGAETPAAQPEASPAGPDLNPRQRWVLDQIAAGAEVRQKTVIEQFRREVNASTVKRDLKVLRELGLIETDGWGCFAMGAGHNDPGT